MSEEIIKDMIEPIPNWEYTYRYDSSRTCEKSYFQSLLDEKNKEITRLNIDKYLLQQRIDKAIKYIKSYLPNYDFDHSNLEKLLEILGDKENE